MEIVGVPTVRESDGLALSSRNAYLKPEERKVAPVLFETLQTAAKRIEGGELNAASATESVRARLARESAIRVEYVEVVDADTVQPVQTIGGPVRIAAAIWLGTTRLIDNIAASPPF
jgi:pantoate--beta-alanine ligase